MTSHRSSRARRVSGRAVTVLANLLLLVTVLGAAAWVAPALLGYDRYVITGGSMSGTYEKGAVVFTESEPVSELAVGDVITYLPPAESGIATLVTHRITGITTDANGVRSLRTQGDANPDPDPWRFQLVDETQPVVTFSVPFVGHALIALADRDTRVLVIGIPAGLVALAALVELLGALRSRGRETTMVRVA
jgi:signal peptidase